MPSDSDDEKQASKEMSDRNGKSKGAAPNPEFWSKVNQDRLVFKKLQKQMRRQIIDLAVAEIICNYQTRTSQIGVEKLP